jgi:hypothetical protein
MMRSSEFAAARTKLYSSAPPVPATIWRMPFTGSGVPSDSCRANRS